MQPWLIAIIAVSALLVLLFALAGMTYGVAFGVRYNKIKLIKYFTNEEFGLNFKEIELEKGLRGGENTSEIVNGKTVVFVHGMGPGHAAYMTEIAYFCNLGYRVIAVDSRGCALSAGKNIGGMYEGVKTAVAAIDYARKNFDGELYLVGHSWGGYSALCASAKRKVEKVVAISAPTSPARTLYEGAARIISKPVAAILYPFWAVINFLKFGLNGNLNAAKCALKNNTPTLLVQGDRDEIVTPKKAVFNRKTGANCVKYLAKGKGHNPYNTVAAEKKLKELQSGLSRARKMTESERASFFENFDYAAATEEDAEVMQEINLFLQS